MGSPFQAVLLIAFGGPQGLDDVRPFLANVVRGRRIAPERLEEVAHHYERFGGISPLTGLTLEQARGLERRLRAAGVPLPVFVGMRNWHPYLADTLAEMSRQGVRRAIGFIAAAHRSYSSCTQYRENVDEARTALAVRGLADVEVTYVGDWHTHPGFIAANAENVLAALGQLPAGVRDSVRVIFTAHSIPESMARQYPYQRQFEETARLVADAVARERCPAIGLRGNPPVESLPFAAVYQSRSGRPEDPWLGPDICDYLREERSRGLEGAVLAPVGFLCDHVEVLYDLDVEAADVCREIGLPMTRARTVNDHPRFLEAMAEMVLAVHRRYAGARPLPLVPA